MHTTVHAPARERGAVVVGVLSAHEQRPDAPRLKDLVPACIRVCICRMVAPAGNEHAYERTHFTSSTSARFEIAPAPPPPRARARQRHITTRRMPPPGAAHPRSPVRSAHLRSKAAPGEVARPRTRRLWQRGRRPRRGPSARPPRGHAPTPRRIRICIRPHTGMHIGMRTRTSGRPSPASFTISGTCTHGNVHMSKGQSTREMPMRMHRARFHERWEIGGVRS